MKLANSSTPTDDEQAVRNLLHDHPREAYLLYRLLNGYHSLATTCIELMEIHKVDTTDVARSFAKKKQTMARLNIPIWRTLEDWTQARKHQQQ